MPVQTVIPPSVDSAVIFGEGNLPEIRITSVSDFPPLSAIVGGEYDGVMAYQLDPNFYYKISSSPAVPFLISNPIFLKFPSVPGPNTAKIRIAAMDGTIFYDGTDPFFLAPSASFGLFFLGGEQVTIIDAQGANLVDFSAGILGFNITGISFGAQAFGKVFDCDNFIFKGEPSFVASGSEDSFVFHNINNQLSIEGLSIFSPSGGKSIIKVSGNVPSMSISRNPVFDTNPTDTILDISPITTLTGHSINDNGVKGSTNLFKAGTTGDITSFADNGGGDTLVNSINAFVGGEEIYITGQNGYRHIGYTVSAPSGGITFELNDSSGTPVPFVLANDGPGFWCDGSLNEKTVGVFASNNGSFPDGKVFGDLLMSGNAVQTTLDPAENNPDKIQGVFESQGNDMVTTFVDGSMVFDGIRPGTAEVSGNMVIFKAAGAIKDYIVRLVKNDNLLDTDVAKWDIPRQFSTLASNFPFLAVVDYVQGDKIQFWLEGVAVTEDPLIAESVRIIVKRV